MNSKWFFSCKKDGFRNQVQHLSLTKDTPWSEYVQESHTDEQNKVVTAPAFMYGEAPLHQIFDGIGNMIAGVMRFMMQNSK